MLILWTATVAGLWKLQIPVWNDILTVGFAHLLAGRAISIVQGTHLGLPPWLIVLMATYADTAAMLILYPLFVYSYEHIVEGHFLQKRMRTMLESAERHVDRFRRFKIAGVFLFVMAPLWMTGIIVGAILGYLLGLRTWVTITTVIIGAFVAVTSWVYAYDLVFQWLNRIHQGLALTLTVALILGLVLCRLIRKRRMAGRDA